jgi:hypothetical protein
LARIESFTVVAGNVPMTALDIVNVLAELGGTRSRFASTNAELVKALKVCPLMDLDRGAVVAEGAREDKTSVRVSKTIRAVRVQLSTSISVLDVRLSKVAIAGNLYIIRGDEEMCVSDSSRWENTRSSSGLGAPRNDDLLNVSDNRIRFLWRPDTEIV